MMASASSPHPWLQMEPASLCPSVQAPHGLVCIREILFETIFALQKAGEWLSSQELCSSHSKLNYICQPRRQLYCSQGLPSFN